MNKLLSNNLLNQNKIFKCKKKDKRGRKNEDKNQIFTGGAGGALDGIFVALCGGDI